MLTALDHSRPARSVVVLEEPDLWRAKGLEDKSRAHPCFGSFVFGRYQQDDQYLDAAARVGEVTAIAPGLEYAVVAAARLAEIRGLPGAGPSAAGILRDKFLLRTVTRSAGMPCPGFRKISSAEELAKFGENRSFVLKPTNRQASVGVIRVCAGTDPYRAWSDSTTASEGNQTANRDLCWEYMAEDYLEGPEFSTECLVRDGQLIFCNVTAKTVLEGEHPVEIGHAVPGWGQDELPIWCSSAQSLIKATGFATGMLHAEWILTASGPCLVECAGRPPGDRITELIDLAYGESFVSAWARLLSGANPLYPQVPSRAAAIRFLSGLRSQPKSSVLAAARGIPGVVRVEVKVPEVVNDSPPQSVRSSWDRQGSAIAVADSPAEAVIRAEETIRALVT
ncbi:MAG: ATP-grasp domain-containing protein [Trebonia sp.]